jgi:hypothetical protein
VVYQLLHQWHRLFSSANLGKQSIPSKKKKEKKKKIGFPHLLLKLQVLGTIVFNYAFVITVPSWVNEKAKFLFVFFVSIDSFGFVFLFSVRSRGQMSA